MQSYFWGKYTKTITIANSDAYVNTLSKTYSASINSYKLDFGVQYQQALNKDNVLTVGATVGLGHKLGADAKLISTNYDNVNALSYSTSDSVPDAFKLPLSIGVGATLLHKNSLTVGVDYNFQKWANIDYPMQGDVLKPAKRSKVSKRWSTSAWVMPEILPRKAKYSSGVRKSMRKPSSI